MRMVPSFVRGLVPGTSRSALGIAAVLLLVGGLWMAGSSLAPSAGADEPPVVPPKVPATPSPGSGGSSSGGGAAPTGPDPYAPESLLRRIELLELQVSYLTSRETALTTYVLEMQDRSVALEAALRRARVEGFTAGAISAPSREALLAGIEALAKDLARSLPQITKEEERYLAEIKQRQRPAGK